MNEKIDESWADFWKNRVLVQYECPAADCSTPQDRRRWMLDSRDAVWYIVQNIVQKSGTVYPTTLDCKPA